MLSSCGLRSSIVGDNRSIGASSNVESGLPASSTAVKRSRLELLSRCANHSSSNNSNNITSSSDNLDSNSSTGGASDHRYLVARASRPDNPGRKIVASPRRDSLHRSGLSSNGSAGAEKSVDSGEPIFTLSEPVRRGDCNKSVAKSETAARRQPPVTVQGGGDGTRAREHSAAIGRSHEQHRRLQFQVHQQLQRIYGNKLQEIESQRQEQQKQQQQQQQLKHSTRGKPAVPLPVANQQRTPFSSGSVMETNQRRQHHHSYGPNSMASRMVRHQQNRHHLQLLHQQSEEQAYDSLNSIITTDPRQQEVQSVANNNLYDLHQNERRNAVILEGVGHLHNSLGQVSKLNRVDLVSSGEDEVEEDDGDDEDERDAQLSDEQQLIREGDQNDPIVMIGRQSKGNPSIVDDRKRQLESLHYATATAAALLNATANAAAAFAAVDQQSRANQLARQNDKCRAAYVRKLVPVIQERTYQDMNNNNLPKKIDDYQVIGAPQQRPLAPNQYRSPPIYARAATVAEQQVPRGRPSQALMSQQLQQNLRQSISMTNLDQTHVQRDSFQQRHIQAYKTTHNSQQQQLPGSIAYAPVLKALPQPVTNPQRLVQLPLIYQQQQQQQQQQSGVANAGQRYFIHQSQLSSKLRHQQQQQLLQHHQQQHQQIVNQSYPQLRHPQLVAHQQHQVLAQPRPSLAVLSSHKPQPNNHLLPALTVPSNGAPAFAILHHNGKTAAMKVDLIRVDEGAASRQHRQATQFQPIQQAQNTAPKQQNGPPLVYGVILTEAKDKHNSAKLIDQQIYGVTKRPLVSADSSDSSEKSGRTNAPLILDRRLKKASLIDKICRVDLTVFWWFLLGVCLIMILVAVTISRYLF